MLYHFKVDMVSFQLMHACFYRYPISYAVDPFYCKYYTSAPNKRKHNHAKIKYDWHGWHMTVVHIMLMDRTAGELDSERWEQNGNTTKVLNETIRKELRSFEMFLIETERLTMDRDESRRCVSRYALCRPHGMNEASTATPKANV